MASRTSSQAGNTNSSPFAFGSAVNAGDSLTINHAVAVDASVSIAGMTINASLTVNSGVTLTTTANVAHGNANFILSAGSAFVFDTTGGNVKWLMGTAASQTACIFKATGSSGSHAAVSKTGSNYAWIDDAGENSGSQYDSTSFDCTYCDFTNIGNSAGTLGIGLNTFGNCSVKFSHCTFDGCGTLLPARPYHWSGAGNKDYIVDDCRWTNIAAGVTSITIISDAGGGSGTKSFQRNALGGGPQLAIPDFTFEDNYFDDGCVLNGLPATHARNTIRFTASDQTHYAPAAMTFTDTYFLADNVVIGKIGNQHYLQVGNGSTVTGAIFEYPHATAVDEPDAIFGDMRTGTVDHCIVLPSATDQIASADLLNPGTGYVADWSMTCDHNTIAGRYATLALVENNRSATVIDKMRSNIIASPSTTDKAWLVNDLSAATVDQRDLTDPAETTYNAVHNPDGSFSDPVSSTIRPGFHCRFNTSPAGPLVSTSGSTYSSGPAFVDDTRNFPEWAVAQGAALSSDTIRAKLDAGRALLLANPSLGGSSLIPWVRAGFAPTNTAYHGTAHDGGDIGAVAWQAAATGTSPSATTMRPRRQFRNRSLVRR